MPYTTLQANKSCIINNETPTDNTRPATAWLTGWYAKSVTAMLVGFAALPTELRHKCINSVNVGVRVSGELYDGRGGATMVVALNEPFDELTANYDIAQNWYYPRCYGSLAGVGMDSLVVGLDYPTEAMRNGVIVYGDRPFTADTSRGTNKPYLVVNYEDATTFIDATPSSGYIDKTKNNTLSWALAGNAYEPFTQVSAKFQWKTSESGAITEIAKTTETTHTIAANAITTDAFMWRVVVTDDVGTVHTSDWYTLTTIEPAPNKPTGLKPNGGIINGSAKFEWTHNISTGSAQTKAIIETSADGNAFTTLATITGADEFYNVQSLVAGELYWRVTTYNQSNVASSASDIAKVLVVSAPHRPSVSVIATPRPTISWQSEGQQGFVVAVGNYNSGVQYGTTKSFKLPIYLNDGVYTAKVKIINKYGLESEWGAVNFTIANVSGAVINLTAIGGGLSWAADGYDSFIVYRNEKEIARTSDKTYNDAFAIGKTNYKVRGVYANSDNYGLSDIVTGDNAVKALTVIDVTTKRTFELPMTIEQERQLSVSDGVHVEYMQFSGCEYPSAEITNQRQRSYTFTAAFLNVAEYKAFLELVGNVVCIKDPQDNMVVGVLDTLPAVFDRHFVSISCTVSQIEVDI